MQASDETGAASSTTPMMTQYLEIKGRHPGSLLFYRMGDFYELFFSDAEAASAALDIALTRRGQHQGADVPMCGVPVQHAEGYLLTLVRKGFRVAIAEQLEEPAEARRRGAKALVHRDVVRLVTPGTLTDEALLDARAANHLACFARIAGEGALAWADISTGFLGVVPCRPGALGEALARVRAAEVLICEDEAGLGGVVAEAGAQVTPLPRPAFDAGRGAKRLADWYGVTSLDGFGEFSRVEVAALAALAGYVEATQSGGRPRLSPPQREDEGETMAIDAATRASLELSRALSGGRAGSLLAAVDRTVTGAGARLLEARLSAPSRRLDVIGERADAVATLVDGPATTGLLREALRGAGDLGRALSRLSLDRGGPRDLGIVRDALGVAKGVAVLLRGDLPALLVTACAALTPPERLDEFLAAALVDHPTGRADVGGLVRSGFSDDLDAQRTLRDEGREVIAGLQAEYAALTGIASLKIKHNGSLGYVVETTATHGERMRQPPLDATFLHRQTTGSVLRFTTEALGDLEERILNAGEAALAIEKQILGELREAVLAEAPALSRLAAGLAEIDVAAALADLALAEGWVRPRIDASRDFAVTAGRHPVVEQALRRQGQSFVANDCDLTETPVRLLTGPNMGGKSTYLRQAALLVVLAQAGSFVPAASMRMGMVSRLFSRVGAADDIGRGRSTFMVEMVETAAILHRADDRSLVLLDEIGRGTATWDGLSIAWAVLEHLCEVNRCRAIFATHYHELAGLAAQLPEASNAHVAVADWDGELVFLHEVRNGAADRSYGVHVARLAGLPPKAVARARQVLRMLEKRAREGGPGALLEDLPLFATIPEEPRTLSQAERRLAAVDPDALSAREALELIYELKGML